VLGEARRTRWINSIDTGSQLGWIVVFLPLFSFFFFVCVCVVFVGLLVPSGPAVRLKK
jgi:hypothetical protein